MDKDIWRTRGSLATYPRYPVSQSPLLSSLHCSCRRVHHHEVPHVHPLPLHPLGPRCARSQRRGNLGGTGHVGGQNHLAGPAAAGRCPPFPGCAGTRSIYVFAMYSDDDSDDIDAANRAGGGLQQLVEMLVDRENAERCHKWRASLHGTKLVM